MERNKFWDHVNICGADECWEWTGGRDGKNYGGVRLGSSMWKAHRVAWMEFYGEDPGELCVLHRCDNPPCCNPGHLFLGTKGDNNRDTFAKGRNADQRGENCPTSKLTNEDVIWIRYWLSKGYKQKDIAESFGVCPGNISMINTGGTWSHV